MKGACDWISKTPPTPTGPLSWVFQQPLLVTAVHRPPFSSSDSSRSRRSPPCGGSLDKTPRAGFIRPQLKEQPSQAALFFLKRTRDKALPCLYEHNHFPYCLTNNSSARSGSAIKSFTTFSMRTLCEPLTRTMSPCFTSWSR